MSRHLEAALLPAAARRDRRWTEEGAALRGGAGGEGATPPAPRLPALEPPCTHASHRAVQPGLTAALALPACAAAAAAACAGDGKAAAAAAAASGGLSEGGAMAAALLRAPGALAATLAPFAGDASLARVMCLALPDGEALRGIAALRASAPVPPPTPNLVAHAYAPKAVPYRDRCPWVQGIRAQLQALREARTAAAEAAKAAAAAFAASAAQYASPAAWSDAALADHFRRVVTAHVLSKSNVADLIQSVVGIPPDKHAEWMANCLTRAEKEQIVLLHTSSDADMETKTKRTAAIISRLLDAGGRAQ
jgi:hypothetical protein